MPPLPPVPCRPRRRCRLHRPSRPCRRYRHRCRRAATARRCRPCSRSLPPVLPLAPPALPPGGGRVAHRASGRSGTAAAAGCPSRHRCRCPRANHCWPRSRAQRSGDNHGEHRDAPARRVAGGTRLHLDLQSSASPWRPGSIALSFPGPLGPDQPSRPRPHHQVDDQPAARSEKIPTTRTTTCQAPGTATYSRATGTARSSDRAHARSSRSAAGARPADPGRRTPAAATAAARSASR